MISTGTYTRKRELAIAYVSGKPRLNAAGREKQEFLRLEVWWGFISQEQKPGGKLIELENTTPSGIMEFAVCRGNDLGEIY